MDYSRLHLDDRLIHGQILYSWCPYYQANSICVVSHRLESDSISKLIMESSVPPSMTVHFLSAKDAATRYATHALSDLFLFDDLLVIEKFWAYLPEEVKWKPCALNISNLTPSAARLKVAPCVGLDYTELSCLERLKEQGINCVIRRTPDE